MNKSQFKSSKGLFLNKLYTVYLFVRNVKESSSWYSKVLNIPLTINEDNFGLIKIGSNEMCFHPADDKSPVSTGGSVADWYVEDLEKHRTYLLNMVALFIEDPLKYQKVMKASVRLKTPLEM